MNPAVCIGESQDLTTRSPDTQIAGGVGTLYITLVQQLHRIGRHNLLQTIARVVVYNQNLIPIDRVIQSLDRIKQRGNGVGPVVDRYNDGESWKRIRLPRRRIN
jgi:hypothetical protein